MKGLCKHIPRLEDIKEGLTGKIAGFLKEENDELVKNEENERSWYDETLDNCDDYWTEISFQTKHFKKNQLFFVFCDWLASGDESYEDLAMRVLIWDEEGLPLKKGSALRKRLEGYGFDPVQSNYGDCWYALSPEYNKPQYKVTEDHDYGEKLIELFFKAFKKEYTKLKKIIT